MIGSCPYCNAFKQAFKNNNYCSIHSPSLPGDKGNTFYVKAGSLESGWHKSRMSFRTVLSGYQRYELQENNRASLLQANNYLIVNRGQEYCNEIDPFTGAESLIITFRDDLFSEIWASLNSDGNLSLDNGNQYPFLEEITFFNVSYPVDASIQRVLIQLKEGVLQESTSTLFYEELHYELAELLIKNHFRTLSVSENLDLIKKSTRLETFRRLNEARDFMVANFHLKLDLPTISRAGAMSPYHFLKSFKALYKKTPQEFLTGERLQYARYLMRHTDLPVNHVTSKSGFENTSSFIRLFKRESGVTPKQYRLNYQQSTT